MAARKSAGCDSAVEERRRQQRQNARIAVKIEESGAVEYAIYDLDEDLKYQLDFFNYLPKSSNCRSKCNKGLPRTSGIFSVGPAIVSLGPIADKLTSGSSTDDYQLKKGRIICPTGSFDGRPTFDARSHGILDNLIWKEQT